jgi:hypothetical protein
VDLSTNSTPLSKGEGPRGTEEFWKSDEEVIEAEREESKFVPIHVELIGEGLTREYASFKDFPIASL